MTMTDTNPPDQPTVSEPQPDQEVDDLLPQHILLASAQHDIPKLKSLLRATRSSLPNPASVQDPETGSTPLHAAVAACEPEEPEHTSKDTNGTNGLKAEEIDPDEEEAARQTVKLLLGEGAIWNDLDNNNETAACVARRIGLKSVYELLVDAGVRAELFLNRLGGYEALDGGSDSEDDETAENHESTKPDEEAVAAENQGNEASNPIAAPSEEEEKKADENPDVNNPTYLRSTLSFQSGRILDSDKNGVMMDWERGIMKRSAERLLPEKGLRVLNVGHGMGIIDTFFQSLSPASHHIIEAHTAVLAEIATSGWRSKPGVMVHEGRWQDVLPDLLAEGTMFDAIYFDTFAEDYSALRDFFSEYVIGLLDPQGGGEAGEGGRFGFFNGLGADRQVCYDVYAKVVEMDLFEAGFDTEWEEVAVPDLDEKGEWEGVKRKYWNVDHYRLPTCRFIA